MPAVQRQPTVLHEIARVFYGIGYTLRNLVSAEPAPYWADYLRVEREKQH